MDTFQQVGPKVGGSFPEPSHGPDQDMEFVAPNLTSHVTGYTGKVPEDLFVTRLRAGRVHATSLMPWRIVHRPCGGSDGWSGGRDPGR